MTSRHHKQGEVQTPWSRLQRAEPTEGRDYREQRVETTESRDKGSEGHRAEATEDRGHRERETVDATQTTHR